MQGLQEQALGEASSINILQTQVRQQHKHSFVSIQEMASR
jgi:hypothetical protein